MLECGVILFFSRTSPPPPSSLSFFSLPFSDASEAGDSSNDSSASTKAEQMMHLYYTAIEVLERKLIAADPSYVKGTVLTDISKRARVSSTKSSGGASSNRTRGATAIEMGPRSPASPRNEVVVSSMGNASSLDPRSIDLRSANMSNLSVG